MTALSTARHAGRLGIGTRPPEPQAGTALSDWPLRGTNGSCMGQFWLARQQGHMKPSGFGSYVSGWRIHVSPRWESVPPAEIRQSDVQSWIAELSAKRWPVVVETCAAVLRRILDDAVADKPGCLGTVRGGGGWPTRLARWYQEQPLLAGLDALFWVDRLDGGAVVL